MFARILSISALSLGLLSASISNADATSCPQHYAGGVEPTFLNESYTVSAVEICYTEFATFYSGQTRTPIYSVEHLTVERLNAARGDERKNTFHEEERIAPQYRSTLDDYRKSGYDRGHLAPSADMTEPHTMHESFSLANMIPQHPANNRGVWANIERAVRSTVFQVGDIYVVTGVAFLGDKVQALKGRVLVPTHVWKAIYVPAHNMASAYLTKNVDDGGKWQEISIDELTAMTGINVFPALDATVLATAIDIQDPEPYRGGGKSASTPASTGDGGSGIIKDIVGGALKKFGIQ